MEKVFSEEEIQRQQREKEVLWKDSSEWTNEDKDWMEDRCLNPEAVIHKNLRRQGIAVSYNYMFYKDKRHLWDLVGIKEGLRPVTTI